MSKDNKKFLIELKESITALKNKYKIKEAERMDMCMIDALMDRVKEHMHYVPCEGCDKKSNGMYTSGNDTSRYFCDKCGDEWRKSSRGER